MPVSGELPFPDQLDRKDDASFARVWHAQLPQIAIPFMGLPGLTVSTGTGRPHSRRRAGGLRPLPRGSLPRRRRGDRGRRNAVGGDRSRRLMDAARQREDDGWRLRFHGTVARRRGHSAEAVRGSGAADRQHRERVRIHAAIQGPRGAAPGASRRAAFRCSDFPATSSAARSRATPRRSKSSASAIMPSRFPMFAKIDVNGSHAHPLFDYLKSEKVRPARVRRSNGISPNSWSIVPARWSRGTRRRRSRKD